MPPPPPSPASWGPQAWGCTRAPALLCSLRLGERRVCRKGPIFHCSTQSPRSSAMRPPPVTSVENFSKLPVAPSTKGNQGLTQQLPNLAMPIHVCPGQSSSLPTGPRCTQHLWVSAWTTQSLAISSVCGGGTAGKSGVCFTHPQGTVPAAADQSHPAQGPALRVGGRTPTVGTVQGGQDQAAKSLLG